MVFRNYLEANIFSESLDKQEITDLLNMMFRFHLRTGSYFKIEEYSNSVDILTDIDKLLGSDLNSFKKKNFDIIANIFFVQLPSYKKLVNLYEDCSKRGKIYSPYTKKHRFMDILNRPLSVNFILDG